MAIKIIGFTDEKDFISLSPDQVEDILGYFLKPVGGPDEYISGDGIVRSFPSSWHWNYVTGKPDTATRWPTWEEVTNKPAAAEPMVNSVSNIIDGNQIHRAALVGDVTAGLNSNTTSIANNVVTNTKLAQVPTGVLKGRVASGTGNVQDLTADVVRSLLNVEDGATAGAHWYSNLSGIPLNITAWASVTPGSKADITDIPTLADYVGTTGAQTGLEGNKSWVGAHRFEKSANSQNFTVARMGFSRNAHIAYETSTTTIYAGVGNVNDTTWVIGTDVNLTTNNSPFQFNVDNGVFYMPGEARIGNVLINGNEAYHTGNLDLSTLVERSIPALDPVGEVGDNGSNYGAVLQPFRIGKNSSADAPSFFGTNASPYLWLGSVGSSSQQGALLGVYASSVNGSRELAFRGRSGSGWSDWARVWHDGNFDPSDYTPTSRTISAGNGLSGGGNLTANRSISLGTPGTLSGSTNNSVTSGSHTHALSTNLSAWDGYHPDNAFVAKGTIPGSVDLNTYRTTGIYHQNANADATSGTNYPANVAGMLTVFESGSMTYQSYQIYNTGDVWTRSRYNTSWSAWKLSVDGTTTITAGNGLSGGGTLAANRTITLGTPGTITATSTNSVSSTSHTHNLDTTGNFTWTGNHTFIGDMIARSGSASQQLTIERTGNSINAAAAYTTTGGTIYAGQGDSGYFNWGTNTDLRYSNAGCWGRIGAGGLEVKSNVVAGGLDTSGQLAVNTMRFTKSGSINYIQSGDARSTSSWAELRFAPYGSTAWRMRLTAAGDMEVSGTISDSTGDVRKLRFVTRNAATTLSASHLNGAVEKSNNSSYTYTIPVGLGSQGDAITFVNSGTGGNITISRATNVGLWRNGTNANVVVTPGSMITIYRSATNNRWIA